jgi:hypothetical protein
MYQKSTCDLMQFLDSTELKALTGYLRPSAQCRWLARNGFRFWVKGDGSVAVPAVQLIAQSGARQRWKPDLSVLDSTR